MILKSSVKAGKWWLKNIFLIWNSKKNNHIHCINSYLAYWNDKLKKGKIDIFTHFIKKFELFIYIINFKSLQIQEWFSSTLKAKAKKCAKLNKYGCMKEFYCFEPSGSVISPHPLMASWQQAFRIKFDQGSIKNSL